MFRIFNQYVSARSLLLMVLEGFLIVLSLLAAVKLRFWSAPAEFTSYTSFPEFAFQSGVVVVVCLACFYCNDLYDLSLGSSAVDQILRVEQSIGAACVLLGLLYFLFPSLLLGRGVFMIGMFLVTGFVVVSRRAVNRAWKLSTKAQRVVILGTGQMAFELAREVSRRDDLGMTLAGFVSGTESPVQGDKVFGIPILGSASEMETIAKHHGVSRIIIALDDRRGVLPTRALVTLKVQGVRVEDASSALSALTGRVPLRAVQPSWFVFTDGFHRSRWNDFLKRVLDLTAGIVGLILSLPVMILVALAVRLDSKGPCLYRQTRVGRMGKCFDVLKFRSMRMDAEQPGMAQWATENDPRTTRVGAFLRKYRLDELPQFLNVIRGEMSFVGPRPERPSFVEDLRKAIPYYDERHSVRPGITGWAQVQYRYGASAEDAFNKLEYDLFYLKDMSLTFDIAIIFRTIRIVLGGFGAR